MIGGFNNINSIDKNATITSLVIVQTLTVMPDTTN